MAKQVLHTESTLTDRYQTTIPEPIRQALHLGKRDKISYVIEANGKVCISRANEDDPDITQFLDLLMKDIKDHPSHLKSLSPTLVERAQSLIEGVDIDLNAPLSDQDE